MPLDQLVSTCVGWPKVGKLDEGLTLETSATEFIFHGV